MYTLRPSSEHRDTQMGERNCEVCRETVRCTEAYHDDHELVGPSEEADEAIVPETLGAKIIFKMTLVAIVLATCKNMKVSVRRRMNRNFH